VEGYERERGYPEVTCGYEIRILLSCPVRLLRIRMTGWRMDVENHGGKGLYPIYLENGRKRVSVCECIFLAAVLSCVRAGSTGAEISKGISQVPKQH